MPKRQAITLNPARRRIKAQATVDPREWAETVRAQRRQWPGARGLVLEKSVSRQGAGA